MKNRSILKRIADVLLSVGLAAATFSAAADDGALLWMIDADSTITRDGTVYSFSDFNDATGFNHGQVVSARISATKEGADSVYLLMYYSEDGGNTYITDPEGLMDTCDLNFGSGNYINSEWASFKYFDGTAVTDLSGLSDYSFALELGNWNSDYTVWNVEAVSDSVAYSDLSGYISPGGAGSPGYEPWNPGTYNVPEPTSGLMLLIGFGLMALRRKENRK